MLCYAMLYYTILYYTILYYTILYYTILYYTMLAALERRAPQAIEKGITGGGGIGRPPARARAIYEGAR